MGDIEGRFVSIFRLSTRASTLHIAGCNQNFLPPPSPLRAEDGQGSKVALELVGPHSDEESTMYGEDSVWRKT